jgi:hypothetical protein
MSFQPLDKTVQFKLGDTYHDLADDFYGDFRNWRELINVNGIGDIFDSSSVVVGRVLRIPTKEEIDILVDSAIGQLRSNVAQNIDYSALDLSVLKTAVSAANEYQLIDWVL